MYIHKIHFYFIRPNTKLPKYFGTLINLLRSFGIDLEILNTKIPKKYNYLKVTLKEICKVPKMSSFPVAAIINSTVSQLPKDQVYVNIGVWEGFTFLAGMTGNPDKTCIGVDNFSEFINPRERFLNRFNQNKSKNHKFYELDYQVYFRKIHKQNIGLYMYDGDHKYKHQIKGLELAEPFFANNCLILVDDTNFPNVKKATLDFIKQSKNNYNILLDINTANNGHPTFWNGLIVFQKIS